MLGGCGTGRGRGTLGGGGTTTVCGIPLRLQLCTGVTSFAGGCRYASGLSLNPPIFMPDSESESFAVASHCCCCCVPMVLQAGLLAVAGSDESAAADAFAVSFLASVDQPRVTYICRCNMVQPINSCMQQQPITHACNNSNGHAVSHTTTHECDQQPTCMQSTQDTCMQLDHSLMCVIAQSLCMHSIQDTCMQSTPT